MTYIDVTADFKDLLHKASSSTPPSRSKSPFGGRSPSRGKGKSKEVEEDEEFLKEAYKIHSHLASLSTFLKTIRRPYLSLQAPSHRTARHRTANTGDDPDDLKRWESSKYLTDKERDEIDLRGKMILRRCRERVSLLEEGEKSRQRATPVASTSTLYSFLPSLAPAAVGDKTISRSLITAHRASVIWTLNDLLAKLSAGLAGLQAERAKRHEERSRTLGGQAAKEAALLQAQSKSKANPIASLFSPSASSSQSAGSSVPKGSNGIDGTHGGLAVVPDDEDIESQLTPEQLQLFSTENNTLLEHMESQLDSVLSAEKSLLEISALQTELVRHLVQQTEITDRLYDEAVGSVGDVGRANEQLKKARERGEEGRMFLLIFLIGASMALLFLDWYS